MKPERIPLFPLNVVLLPSALLPLHIFEPRYREMTARCLEEKIAFGMIYAPSGGIAQIGCTATIERVLKSYPDGRSDILTIGTDVFRMVRLLDEKPYYEAIVEYPSDEPFAQSFDENLAKEMIELFEKCRSASASQISEADPSDPLLSYKLASQLALELHDKQQLLECRSERDRRSLLVNVLKELLPKIERTDRTRMKAAGNGHSPV
jgi:ATP-dependent Lon protease